ncbi:uncharacterized protein LOC117116937 [Anneissia japonica]|uniref:uncharacterized protein LOC117116937 n=1 Tax=Anneissia japonica TaxID=1529436 RepID=UPI0014256C7C|nr:uncharacterized protein LOC117116937 [Anneissia japonica]
MGWDDPIPAQSQKEWKAWLADLSGLENIRIPRCLKPSNFGEVTNAQLHHFANASLHGYGTVTYLRSQNTAGNIHVGFVTAKARVAPLKPHTIVKLELTAAASAVRQDDLLHREMTIKLQPSIFWTDSQTVLKYISNEKSRYPVFVANRVAVIRDGSTLEAWRYVPGKLYPADHASMGLKAQDLMRHKEWISGPDFLAMSQKEWPVMEDIPPNGDTSHNDIQESQCNAIGVSEAICQYDSLLNRLIRHYSDWTKLKRAVAYYIILKGMLRKVKESHLLTARKLEVAEIAIIKYIQTTNFPQKELGKGSNLTKLNPKLNEGILRVGAESKIHPFPKI